MSDTAPPLSRRAADDSEELARAELYGLLARLLARRPTPRCWSSSRSR